MEWLMTRLILVIVFALAALKSILLGNVFLDNERVLSKKMKHYRLMVVTVGVCAFIDILCMTYLMVFPIRDILRITLLVAIVAGSMWTVHVIKYKMIYKLNERN